MSRRSIESKQELLEELQFSMKKCYMGQATIDYCLNNASGQVLDALLGIFKMESERRVSTRIANLIKSAGFPTIKCIDDYDSSQLKLPPQLSFETLKSLDFIKEKHTLIMHGICGSGKTMLSICIGILACQKNMNVKFYTLSQLAEKLKTMSDAGRLESFLIGLKQLDLLIIDEWGYTSFDSASANLIYRVISDSYEQKSLIITTNIAFSEWGKLFADDQIAAEIIDRIVHYGYPINCGNIDWRLQHSPMKNMAFTNETGNY